MLDFEAALAQAEAEVGVIPAEAVSPIVDCCRAGLFDFQALGLAAVNAGNLAIPMVKALTALVKVKDGRASGYVHWGATSQDAIDTGMVLQLRPFLYALDGDLTDLCKSLALLVESHRDTPMVGRTWLQQALPITFGLKAAGWLDAAERARARLRALQPVVLTLQFGGAAGTLAALGDQGLRVAAALAARLDLALPALPWHGHRDRIAEAGAALGLLIGTLGKIASDITLCMQTEIGELLEPAGEGRGGSSTMPHKRNPVAAAAVLAAAARAPGLVATLLSAMPQQHERGLGNWHAEWTALPELCRLAGGALHRTLDTVKGLEVHGERMAENLERTQGLILAEAVQMALGARLGRGAAHDLLDAACRRAVREKRHLREILQATPEVTAVLSVAEIDRLLDPRGYLGVTQDLIDRALRNRS